METKFVNNDFADILLNRHSVRHYDPSVKIDRDELTQMIEQAITAPSACNLQAWKFVVVDSDDAKAKLRETFLPFNYPQIDTCSAMVLIFADAYAFHSYRDLWNGICEAGRITPEKRDEVLKTFLPLYEAAPKEMLIVDAQRDAAMAAMQLMLLARAHGYDSNPIAGYKASALAPLYGLDPDRYYPCMAVAIGKADPEWIGKEVQSVRYPVADLVDFA